MLALFVGWGAFFIYTLVRFRARRNPRADHDGVKGHFSSWLEGAVAIIEAALLIGLAFPIWARVKTAAPPSPAAVEARVIAQQFAWNIHYPGEDGIYGRTDPRLVNEATNPIGLDCTDPNAMDDIVSLNNLHVPVSQMTMLQVSSKDVIHSFSLPIMRVKQDTIPGMAIPVWFTPLREGKSEIACAQLCGLGHYKMRGFLHVESEEGFRVWKAAEERFCAPEDEDEEEEDGEEQSF
jgi:cytochrome c oxidase subunit II